MHKVRDLIYIGPTPHSKAFQLHGITFREFVLGAPRPLNLLLLRTKFLEASWDAGTQFEFVEDERLDILLKEDIYDYGDFWWMDFKSQACLNTLSKADIAAICYLAHTGQPFRSPFLPKLRNTFIYQGHDDGWYLRLYCRKTSSLERILASVLGYKFRVLAKQSGAPDVPLPVCRNILQHANEGVLIALRDMAHSESPRRNRRELDSTAQSPGTDWKIPVRQLIVGEGMDSLLNHYETLSKTSPLIGHLVYEGQTWRWNAARQET